MKISFLIGALLISVQARASCQVYHRAWGQVDLAKGTWETLHVKKEPTTICGALPLPAITNLEVKLTKGKKTFTTTIFQTLDGFDETHGSKGSFAGGPFSLKTVSVDTFVPEWYPGSQLSLKQLETKQTIAQGKL